MNLRVLYFKSTLSFIYIAWKTFLANKKDNTGQQGMLAYQSFKIQRQKMEWSMWHFFVTEWVGFTLYKTKKIPWVK